MAHPKRRHSKSRRDKRRTHDNLNKPSLSVCPQCKQAKRSHRICLHCGYYNGKQVIEIKPKKKKQKR
ncbi:MAG: 50S ribosomal protein L32 [Candidatus Omnitrophica bacterium]|nr:50S ribosomal protein L32 [Candidatus Omnitrophota bacterium]